MVFEKSYAGSAALSHRLHMVRLSLSAFGALSRSLKRQQTTGKWSMEDDL